MSDSEIEDQVRDFYQSENISQSTLDRIIAGKELAMKVRKWRTVAVAALSGLAAMTLLGVALQLRQVQSPARDEVTPGVAEKDSAIETETANDGDPTGEETPSPTYQLVAFRSHSDQCPDCRATGAVYRELVTMLSNEEVQFAEFDLSKPDSSSDVKAQIDERGLTPLVEDRIETAFLALVDPAGKRIKEYKPSLKPDFIASSVRELIQTK